LIYRLAGYRTQVVAENLQKSFPEKTEKERKLIERKFYHFFADMFIETLYLTHISPKRHAKRLIIENKEVIDGLYEKGKSVICVTGHYGNWEFSRLFPSFTKYKLYAIYKKLNSKAFDRFYKDLRSKDGAVMLEMRQTYKQLVTDARNGENYLAVFIADQRPLKNEIKFWMPFLNQDTPVLLGTEKIAKKTNSVVVWAEIQKVKRGYYKVVFKVLTEEPRSTEEYEITRMHMQQLEKAIQRCPETWLWTHKRWKHQREQSQ
jgi:KDO2-lipid IV(A) lauroyltransferase